MYRDRSSVNCKFFIHYFVGFIDLNSFKKDILGMVGGILAK